jgi:hypothetical protein
MNAESRSPLVLRSVGFVAMLVGALDPMEGSVLILVGSGLAAVGFFLARKERRLVGYWVTVFLLIAVGVAALWVLSALGGVGGSTGRSLWWLGLGLPYLAGWIMAVWGQGPPRWFSWLALAVGVVWVALPFVLLVLARNPNARGPMVVAPIVLGILGLATIAGCAQRLRHSVA